MPVHQRLHIWGNNHQVAAATKELVRLTNTSKKPSSSESNNPNFLKLRIDSEKKQKMLEKRMEQEAEKQKYRQAPEDSAVFVVHVSHSLGSAHKPVCRASGRRRTCE